MFYLFLTASLIKILKHRLTTLHIQEDQTKSNIADLPVDATFENVQTHNTNYMSCHFGSLIVFVLWH